MWTLPAFELFLSFFLAIAAAGLCWLSFEAEAALPSTAPEPRASGRGEALVVDLRPPQSHAPRPPLEAPPRADYVLLQL